MSQCDRQKQIISFVFLQPIRKAGKKQNFIFFFLLQPIRKAGQKQNFIEIRNTKYFIKDYEIVHERRMT
jgi:hypothetical protein